MSVPAADPQCGTPKRVCGWHPDRFTRYDALALGFLFVLAFALHARLLLVGQVLVGEDLSRVEAPVRAVYVSALREGRLPIWYPRLNLGTPMFAESQLGQLHPVNLAIFSVLPARAGGVVWTVLLCFLSGAFMYLFGREIGLAVGGRTLAGVVFMLSGFFLAHVNHLYTFLLQGVHVPLALLLAERIATRRGRWAPWWAAIVIGLAVLAGHYQLTFMALLLYVLYGLWRSAQTGQGIGGLTRRALWLLLPVPVAAGLSAVQWMPTWELAQRLVSRVRIVGEMHPGQLVAYVSPYLFQSQGGLWLAFWERADTNYWESLAYVGLVPLCLVGVAWGRRRAVPMVKPLVAGALLFTLLSMGTWLPTYRLLLALPGFGYFRAAGRYTFGASVCLAALAGIGMDHAAVRTRAGTRHRLFRFAQFLSAAMLLALLVGVMLAFWARPAEGEDGGAGFASALVRMVLRWSVSLPVAAASVWAVWRLVTGRKWAVGVAVLVAAADLFIVGLACERVAVEPASLRDINRPGPVARHLVSAAGGGRVLCARHMWPVGPERDLIYFGSPNLPAYQTGLWELPDRPYVHAAGIIRAYGVRFIISDRRIIDARLRLVYEGPDAQMRAVHGRVCPARVYLYECRQVMPRAYLVDRAVWLPDWAAVGKAMTRPGFDPSRVVLLEGSPDRASRATGELPASARRRVLAHGHTGGSSFSRQRPRTVASPAPVREPLRGARADKPPVAPGACTIAVSDPGRVRIEVDAARPAWLVLSDLYYPGWVAEIEGCRRTATLAVPLSAENALTRRRRQHRHANPCEGSDGRVRPLTIRRANVMVRAVRVPAGRHMVTFTYRPRSLRIGACVSLAACALLALGGLAWAWWHWRRPRQDVV